MADDTVGVDAAGERDRDVGDVGVGDEVGGDQRLRSDNGDEDLIDRGSGSRSRSGDFWSDDGALDSARVRAEAGGPRGNRSSLRVVGDDAKAHVGRFRESGSKRSDSSVAHGPNRLAFYEKARV